MVSRAGRRAVGLRSRDYQIFSDGWFTSFSYTWCSAARASRLGAPLIRTPKGQSEVSALERCTYKRGHYDDVTFDDVTDRLECSVTKIKPTIQSI